MIRSSLTAKLIISFSTVIIVGILLSVITGIRLIGSTIIQQAQDKVRLDLNSAREIYQKESEHIKTVIRITAGRFFIREMAHKDFHESLFIELKRVMEEESLDLLTLVDKDGYVILRVHNPTFRGDRLSDSLLHQVLLSGIPLVATTTISSVDLSKEGDTLVKQAYIERVNTPHAGFYPYDSVTTGMFIIAAAPIYNRNGNRIGALYGGKLLNQNYEIVDKVKNIVYRNEMYKGRDVGTATIFLNGFRISTNVVRKDGNRAIGTQVSEEVYAQVIERGIPWIGRAFVVDDWFITAYEPICDNSQRIIGMLYVGMLEAPYKDLQKRVTLIFLLIACASVTLLSIVAYFSTIQITRPVKQLLDATNKVANGDLTQRVEIGSKDEIGQLAGSFNHMTASLHRITQDYQDLASTLEKKVEEKTSELEAARDHLIRTEKLSSLGKLAAGVAHEINNPLTAVLINSHLIAETLQDDDEHKEKLDLIIDETTRCSHIVKGLLEFSRQTSQEKRQENVNRIIEKILSLFATQIMATNVKICKELDGTIPDTLVDVSKIEQVFTNVMLNALDAMPEGGTLEIATRISNEKSAIEISFKDTGCGIPKKNIDRIFDPFFTTKGTKGTGLGLAVSYGIVQQHGGTIVVQSEQGVGTTILIYLPLNSAGKNTEV